MYPPAIYLDDDPAFIRRILRDYSFAILTCSSKDGPLVTHLPLLEHEGWLYGHIARENPMVEALDGAQVFKAVFSGPHAYISASLYDRPEKSVPTWDYTAVHIAGIAKPLTGTQSESAMVQLAKTFEPQRAWTIEGAKAYVEALMPHITPFKMRVDTVTGFRKLSTIKNIKTGGRITDALKAQGEADLAQEILRRQKDLS